MKKKVYLLRHAQTAGKQAGQRDYDRELTPEGERQVNNLARAMVKSSLLPEFILSSSSARTRRTSQLIHGALHLQVSQMLFLDSLYEAPTAAWLQQLKQLPSSLISVLFVGHNPAISHLASLFASRAIELPAGGFIGFEFLATTWQDLPEVGNEIARITDAH